MQNMKHTENAKRLLTLSEEVIDIELAKEYIKNIWVNDHLKM